MMPAAGKMQIPTFGAMGERNRCVRSVQSSRIFGGDEMENGGDGGEHEAG